MNLERGRDLQSSKLIVSNAKKSLSPESRHKRQTGHRRRRQQAGGSPQKTRFSDHSASRIGRNQRRPTVKGNEGSWKHQEKKGSGLDGVRAQLADLKATINAVTLEGEDQKTVEMEELDEIPEHEPRIASPQTQQMEQQAFDTYRVFFEALFRDDTGQCVPKLDLTAWGPWLTSPTFQQVLFSLDTSSVVYVSLSSEEMHLDPGAVLRLLSRFPALRVVKLDRFAKPLALLRHLQECCPKVKSITIENCNFQDKELRTLAKIFPDMRGLGVPHNPALTNQGLHVVFRKCSELRYIDLSGCDMVNDDSLPELVDSNRGVKVFLGKGLHQLTNTSLLALLLKWLKIEKLDLEGWDITDKGMLAFYQFPEVWGLRERPPLETLRSLSVAECPEITCVSMGYIGVGCPLIEDLNLTRCINISNKGMGALRNLAHLKKLLLEGCERIGNLGMELFLLGDQNDGPSTARALEVLNMRGLRLVSDPGIVAVSRSSRKMKELVCSGISRDTSAQAIISLSQNCNQLEKLDWWGSQSLLQESVIRSFCIKRRWKLKELKFGACTIDVAVLLPTLRVVKVLETLGMNDCLGLGADITRFLPRTLTKLEITCCHVDDAAIALIPKRCLKLEDVDLSRCPDLTDKVLEDFRRCPFLHRFNAFGCQKISNSALARVASLQTKVPCTFYENLDTNFRGFAPKLGGLYALTRHRFIERCKLEQMSASRIQNAYRRIVKYRAERDMHLKRLWGLVLIVAVWKGYRARKYARWYKQKRTFLALRLQRRFRKRKKEQEVLRRIKYWFQVLCAKAMKGWKIYIQQCRRQWLQAVACNERQIQRKHLLHFFVIAQQQMADRVHAAQDLFSKVISTKLFLMWKTKSIKRVKRIRRLRQVLVTVLPCEWENGSYLNDRVQLADCYRHKILYTRYYPLWRTFVLLEKLQRRIRGRGRDDSFANWVAYTHHCRKTKAKWQSMVDYRSRRALRKWGRLAKSWRCTEAAWRLSQNYFYKKRLAGLLPDWLTVAQNTGYMRTGREYFAEVQLTYGVKVWSAKASAFAFASANLYRVFLIAGWGAFKKAIEFDRVRRPYYEYSPSVSASLVSEMDSISMLSAGDFTEGRSVRFKSQVEELGRGQPGAMSPITMSVYEGGSLQLTEEQTLQSGPEDHPNSTARSEHSQGSLGSHASQHSQSSHHSQLSLHSQHSIHSKASFHSQHSIHSQHSVHSQHSLHSQHSVHSEHSFHSQNSVHSQQQIGPEGELVPVPSVETDEGLVAAHADALANSPWSPQQHHPSSKVEGTEVTATPEDEVDWTYTEEELEAARKVQSKWRQKKATDERWERLWAAQLLTRKMRGFVARKRFWKERRAEARRKALELYLQEERETALMEIEDKESLDWENVHRIVLKVQQRWRSHVAWKKLMRLRVMALEQKKEVELGWAIWQREEAKRLAREAKEEAARQQRLANVIQNAFRVYAAKKLARKAKEAQHFRKYVVKVQAAYRARIGRRIGEAYRRNQAMQTHVQFRRQKEGDFFRSLNVNRRKYNSGMRIGQVNLRHKLSRRGLSPVDFCTSSEEFRDFINDYRTCVDAFKYFQKMVKAGGLRSQFVRIDYKKAWLKKYNARFVVKSGNVVQVIYPNHKRQGETGYVLALDTTEDNEVAEVRFDRDGKTEFVPLVSEYSVLYGELPILMTVDQNPFREILAVATKGITEGWREALIAWAEEEHQNGKKKAAAIRIQCFFRQISARRRVELMRETIGAEISQRLERRRQRMVALGIGNRHAARLYATYLQHVRNQYRPHLLGFLVPDDFREAPYRIQVLRDRRRQNKARKEEVLALKKLITRDEEMFGVMNPASWNGYKPNAEYFGDHESTTFGHLMPYKNRGAIQRFKTRREQKKMKYLAPNAEELETGELLTKVHLSRKLQKRQRRLLRKKGPNKVIEKERIALEKTKHNPKRTFVEVLQFDQLKRSRYVPSDGYALVHGVFVGQVPQGWAVLHFLKGIRPMKMGPLGPALTFPERPQRWTEDESIMSKFEAKQRDLEKMKKDEEMRVAIQAELSQLLYEECRNKEGRIGYEERTLQSWDIERLVEEVLLFIRAKDEEVGKKISPYYKTEEVTIPPYFKALGRVDDASRRYRVLMRKKAPEGHPPWPTENIVEESDDDEAGCHDGEHDALQERIRLEEERKKKEEEERMLKEIADAKAAADAELFEKLKAESISVGSRTASRANSQADALSIGSRDASTAASIDRPMSSAADLKTIEDNDPNQQDNQDKEGQVKADKSGEEAKAEEDSDDEGRPGRWSRKAKRMKTQKAVQTSEKNAEEKQDEKAKEGKAAPEGKKEEPPPEEKEDGETTSEKIFKPRKRREPESMSESDDTDDEYEAKRVNWRAQEQAKHEIPHFVLVSEEDYPRDYESLDEAVLASGNATLPPNKVPADGEHAPSSRLPAVDEGSEAGANPEEVVAYDQSMYSNYGYYDYGYDYYGTDENGYPLYDQDQWGQENPQDGENEEGVDENTEQREGQQIEEEKEKVEEDPLMKEQRQHEATAKAEEIVAEIVEQSVTNSVDEAIHQINKELIDDYAQELLLEVYGKYDLEEYAVVKDAVEIIEPESMKNLTRDEKRAARRKKRWGKKKKEYSKGEHSDLAEDLKQYVIWIRDDKDSGQMLFRVPEWRVTRFGTRPVKMRRKEGLRHQIEANNRGLYREHIKLVNRGPGKVTLVASAYAQVFVNGQMLDRDDRIVLLRDGDWIMLGWMGMALLFRDLECAALGRDVSDLNRCEKSFDWYFGHKPIHGSPDVTLFQKMTRQILEQPRSRAAGREVDRWGGATLKTARADFKRTKLLLENTILASRKLVTQLRQRLEDAEKKVFELHVSIAEASAIIRDKNYDDFKRGRAREQRRELKKQLKIAEEEEDEARALLVQKKAEYRAFIAHLQSLVVASQELVEEAEVLVQVEKPFYDKAYERYQAQSKWENDLKRVKARWHTTVEEYMQELNLIRDFDNSVIFRKERIQTLHEKLVQLQKENSENLLKRKVQKKIDDLTKEVEVSMKERNRQIAKMMKKVKTGFTSKQALDVLLESLRLAAKEDFHILNNMKDYLIERDEPELPMPEDVAEERERLLCDVKSLQQVLEAKQLEERMKQKEQNEKDSGSMVLSLTMDENEEASVKKDDESVTSEIKMKEEEGKKLEAEVEKLFEADPSSGFGQAAVKVPGYCYKTLRCYLSNGRIQGQVLIETHDGCKYEGPWTEEEGYIANFTHMPKHAMVDGQGTTGKWTMEDGTVYIGEQVTNRFKVEDATGKMTIYLPDGSVYEGGMLHGEFHGHGQLQFSPNSHKAGILGGRYLGEFRRGKRHGRGRQILNSREVYDGEWLEDMMHGKGKHIFEDGSSYKGRFVRNRWHGYGERVFSNADWYKGSFRAGQMHGKGEMVFATGERFAGMFVDNKKHGPGLMVLANGERLRGEWKDGHLEGDVLWSGPMLIDGHVETVTKEARYEKDEMMGWLSTPITKAKTRAFIEQFCKIERMDDKGTEKIVMKHEEFFGEYAYAVAPHIPDLPPGVDKEHPVVQNIVKKLGHFKTVHKFFGEKRIETFPSMLQESTRLLQEIDAKISYCENKVNLFIKQMREYQTSVSILKEEILEKENERGDIINRVKSYWDVERLRTTTRALGLHKVLGQDYRLTIYPHKAREDFRNVVNTLLQAPMADYDKLRKHHSSKKPTPLLTTLLLGVAKLLRQPLHFRGILFMLSDKDWNIAHEASPRNSPEDMQLLVKDKIGGDYTVKLLWLIQNWDLYQWSTPEHFNSMKKYVQPVLYNPRITKENIKLMKKSPVVEHLIDFCRICYDYIIASQMIHADVESLEDINNKIMFLTTKYMDQKKKLFESEHEIGRAKKALREAKEPRLDCWAKKKVLEELLAEVEEVRKIKPFEDEIIISKDGEIQVVEVDDNALLDKAYGEKITGYTGNAVTYFGALKEIDKRLAKADLFDMVDYAATAEGDVAIVQSSLALSDILFGANWDRTQELIEITTKYEVGDLREAYVKSMSRHQAERELWTDVVQTTYTRTLNAFEKFQVHLPPRKLEWYIDKVHEAQDEKHLERSVKNVRFWLQEHSGSMYEKDYDAELTQIEDAMDQVMDEKENIIEESETLDTEFDNLEKQIDKFRNAAEERTAAEQEQKYAQDGWEQIDTGDGGSYWHNVYTGDTTWEHPSTFYQQQVDPFYDHSQGYGDDYSQQWLPAMSQDGGVYFMNEQNHQDVRWTPP